jgi:hypothetical protein
MFSNRFAADVVAAFVATWSLTVQAQAINVDKWPDDVPCDALRKNADGSYDVTKPITRFFVTHTGITHENTRETRYWDQKCKGATK